MKIESPFKDVITARSCCAGSDVGPLTVMAIQPRDRFVPQSAAAVACFTALCHTVLAQKGNGCGHTVLGRLSGTLASANYPHAYFPESVCHWEIRVPNAARLALRFADFDVPTQNHCQESYVKIYDGIASLSVIDAFCGTLDEGGERTFLSAGNEVTIRFQSGSEAPGRGFLLSYSSVEHRDELITCLETGANFTEHEFSKFCPAGCLTSFGVVSGSIPTGYRDSSPLCKAAVHAGVVAADLGGQVDVVQSKGRSFYESQIANGVASVRGKDSTSLFTFKTSGCYGRLGLASGAVRDSQLSASSQLTENAKDGGRHAWPAAFARLNRSRSAWVARHADTSQWLQVDLGKRRKVTGIITAGSGGPPHPTYFVSMYRLQGSVDRISWDYYKTNMLRTPRLFQGNADSEGLVRNNLIPPMEARFVRVLPMEWHQKIALRLELLGCEITASPRAMRPLPPEPEQPVEDTTHTVTTPAVLVMKNNTIPSRANEGVELVAVVVPASLLLCILLIILCLCACRRGDRSRTKEAYTLPCAPQPPWLRNRASRGLKVDDVTPSIEPSDVRYSSEVGRLPGAAGLGAALRNTIPEYEPLVMGSGSLGKSSTFRPAVTDVQAPQHEYTEPQADMVSPPSSYSSLAPYAAPAMHPAQHLYAEPVVSPGPEYATPIGFQVAPSPSLRQPVHAPPRPAAPPPALGYDTPRSVRRMQAETTNPRCHVSFPTVPLGPGYDTPKSIAGLNDDPVV
uniref:discoidin, CUB and LCCL domain-containing protein 2-like n=1 Tax=Myxine glutinosa TaxID=7769 RepID=UPI00358F294C